MKKIRVHSRSRQEPLNSHWVLSDFAFSESVEVS